ncbi:hypothetical protein SAMN05877753_102107 [Bacillus oleivorans]|uniref:DUF4190 domain-containing protein n=1 Tax=Bacillus oleivorans TaxID=1448271 RepID=A0A285CLN0_9BACI|nr:hypothetical protein [Bacillus oleivorans]SNX67903.1 hypothetical protein SAMN05877753_102107 [Bacillus oleivorans]
MADERKFIDHNIDVRDTNEEIMEQRINNGDYLEEASTEVAAPFAGPRRNERANTEDTETGGRGLGYVGIALSILALFVLPVLFGAAGIVLGFIARRRGAEGIGATAIGIGAAAIILSLFLAPFF